MTKRLLWQIPLLLFLIGGTLYIAREQRNAEYRFAEGKIFGTYYHITYQSSRDLHQEIIERLQAVDNSLSMFNDSSTISRVNKSVSDSLAPRTSYLAPRTIDVSDDKMFCEVFELAQSISEATDGAFDITIAPLVNAWGFGFKNDAKPTKAAVDSMLAFTGYKKVTLHKGSLTKQHPQLMLDCSAIAKGYGVDVVAQLLRTQDVKNFMVEIGGEIVVSGVNQEQEAWRVGVTKPVEDPEGTNHELQAILQLPIPSPISPLTSHLDSRTSHLAPRTSPISPLSSLATSGNYRNFYYKDGKRYAHTIDPKTGYPVEHRLLSATVIAGSCAIADAYATAFMVMGLDKALEILNKHPELMAYLIYSDSNNQNAVWCSPELKKYIE